MAQREFNIDDGDDERDLDEGYALAVPEHVMRRTPASYVQLCVAHANGMKLRDAFAHVAAMHEGRGVSEARFYAALKRDENLRTLYRRAKKEFLMREAERILELVDDTPCFDATDVAKLALRVKTRQWLFQRLLPAYRDKQDVSVAGAGTVIVLTGVPRGEDTRDDAQALEELMQ